MGLGRVDRIITTAPVILIATILGAAAVPALVGRLLAPSGSRLWSAWSLGAIAIATATVCALAIGLAPWAGGVILAVVTGIAAQRSVFHSNPIGFETSRSEIALCTWLTLILIAGALITVARPVVESDAIAIWYPKVRAFLTWAPFDRWPVPFYPPLGAVLWGLPMFGGGPAFETIGRSIFTAMYVAWAAALRETCPRPLSPIHAVTIGAVALAGFDYASITSGYQDPLLAAVAGIAGIFLACDLIDRRPGAATTGLSLCGTLGLIKGEGLVLGFIMAGSWLVFRFVTDRRAAPAGWSAPWNGIAVFVAGTALWPIISRAYGVAGRPDWLPDSLAPSLLVNGLDRLPAILGRMLTLRPTYYLPVAAALAVIALATRRATPARPALVWLLTVQLLYTAAAIGLFMVTTAPLDWHLNTLLWRVMGQQLMLWFLAIVIGII